MNERILVVDDEEEIVQLLEVYLKSEGFQVFSCYCAKEAKEVLKKEKIDLALLDVMLPDMSGFDLCQEIREESYFPIIMVTAKVEDLDMLTGLTVGADDYIRKPFKPIEVIARVKTQLRRYKRYNEHTQEEKNVIDIRGLMLDEKTHTAKLYEKELNLTPIEFSILWYLCSRQGQVVSSEELFEAVWKEKFLDSNNTVMTHIGRLRDKLKENAKKPKFIKTVWGVGYKVE